MKDVSFDVQQGEVVGIIGRNGAGKSTLLKILSQITEPTEGEIRMRGRVASLLSLWLDTENGQAQASHMNTEENQFSIPVDDVKKQFLSYLRMCA